MCESTTTTMFLTLSFKGASLEVPFNQFARKRKKKFQKKPKNVKHRRNRYNENVTHVKSSRHETYKHANK